ncbi:MAG: hypothetical protein AAGF23_19735 [Acidobacteriota bacterium]
MPRKTSASLLILLLMIALALPTVAAPVPESSRQKEEAATSILSSLRDVWEWTVALVALRSPVEDSQDAIDDDEEPPLPNAFPGYEPVG